jgi:hypothetical protein
MQQFSFYLMAPYRMEAILWCLQSKAANSPSHRANACPRLKWPSPFDLPVRQMGYGISLARPRPRSSVPAGGCSQLAGPGS